MSGSAWPDANPGSGLENVLWVFPPPANGVSVGGHGPLHRHVDGGIAGVKNHEEVPRSGGGGGGAVRKLGGETQKPAVGQYGDVNRIGIDLGGTKIEMVALASDGSELCRQRVPTPSGDYQGIVEEITRLVERADELASPTFRTIGVGTPGVISPRTDAIKNSNSTVLNGKPLHIDLSKSLGRPLVMMNDAACFALSEARDGAGAGARVVFGVIVGTGVGGGIVVGEETLVGLNGLTGEWGHNPLPWPQPGELPGESCYCGKSGCIETFLSGPGFERLFLEGTGRSLRSMEIVEEARSGERPAAEAFESYVDRMARALASLINVFDPDVIVLGGGMSNVDELYKQVPQRWGRYVFGGEVVTRLVRNVHGDSSGVRGAAWLVEEA